MTLQFDMQGEKRLLPTPDQLEVFKSVTEATRLIHLDQPLVGKVLITLIGRSPERIDVNLESQIIDPRNGRVLCTDISVFQYSLFNLDPNVQRALQKWAAKASSQGFSVLNSEPGTKLSIAA